jgi:hypothetical protein
VFCCAIALSSLMRYSQQVICLLAWAVDSWSSNHWLFQMMGLKFLLLLSLGCWSCSSNHWWGEDVCTLGRFFSAMTSLSRYLEEAAFNISISSSVFIFQWLCSRCLIDLVLFSFHVLRYLKLLFYFSSANPTLCNCFVIYPKDFT